ncbi:hypothetical protein [Atopococcus tabaci]|uniref:hypothetical protein n=1 Tax=Atopococcus tabaci TaxID=269774 RepID=UPI000415FC58|nr:hypothetical protein [Atopococcus tabaci]
MGKLKKRWPVIVAAIVVAELLGLGADEKTNGETTISGAVATVEEASQHTAALDNGKYTYRLQTTEQEASEHREEAYTEAGLPTYMEDMLTVDLEEDDIKAVEIRQEEEHTVYTFLYTEENATGSYFSALEQAVEMQQNTRFKEAKTSMTVDESGLLTQVRAEHTVEQTLDGTLHTGKTLRETTLVDDNNPTIEIEDPSN